MNNNDARQYFKQSNLSYEDLTIESINQLRKLISKELKKTTNLKMTLSRKDKNHFLIKNGKLYYSSIRVDSFYFSKREGISFNPDGFIGFAGWADSENTEPFINAFVKWCDWLRAKHD